MQSASTNLAVYHTIKPSTRTMEFLLLACFNLLLVGSAYISINLPFSPVPITGQTFGVLLIAMALGRVRATAVVAAYLLEGVAGLPVFAGGATGPGILLGPTGGYLVGFVAAAWTVGYLADMGWDKNIFKSVLAMTTGTALIFVFGLAQLSLFLNWESLLVAGLIPFLPGAALKIALASAVLPSVWRFIGKK